VPSAFLGPLRPRVGMVPLWVSFTNRAESRGLNPISTSARTAIILRCHRPSAEPSVSTRVASAEMSMLMPSTFPPDGTRPVASKADDVVLLLGDVRCFDHGHVHHYLCIFDKGRAVALYHTQRLASPGQRIVFYAQGLFGCAL
jgi:hypothetical protein